MKPFILLTNDDGVGAPGIQALKRCIGTLWDTIIVAPDREQSAASHALTLNRPLRVNRIDDRTMTVDGTPTDCVLLSLTGLLGRTPDLVISGINSGANLGDDVIYSGTVAGAAESTVLGIPAVAVSLVDPSGRDFTLSAEITVKIARVLMEKILPKGVFLNMNIPCEWTGKRIEVTNLGNRTYRDIIVEKKDPRGKPYYWIGGHVDAWQGDDTCDFAAVARGNVSITPLHLDMTAAHALDELRTWDFVQGI